MVPLDLDDDMPARDAEVALAFLVEQGMVEVAGDTITVPARFWTGSRPLIRHTAPGVPWLAGDARPLQPPTR